MYLYSLFIQSDLNPLGNMPYLVSLDVSHNQLNSVLDFSPPLGLRVSELKQMTLKLDAATEMRTLLDCVHYCRGNRIKIYILLNEQYLLDLPLHKKLTSLILTKRKKLHPPS